MQLRASGYDPPMANVFASVMVTYLVNLAVPRAGEVARCSALTKSDKVPLATGFGTVVVERILDAFVLLLLILLMATLESQKIIQFFNEIFGGGEEASGPSPILILAGVGVVFMGIAWIFRKKLLEFPIVQKIVGFVGELIQSALSIRKIKQPGMYVVYTILIWICYWMMTYVAFFSLEQTATLNINLLYFGLIVTIIGGIGMALPSPGGIGSYHFAVKFTFVAFAVLGTAEASGELGLVFAVIMHASQIVMMIVAGAIAFLYLWIQKPRDSAIDKPEPKLDTSTSSNGVLNLEETLENELQ